MNKDLSILNIIMLYTLDQKWYNYWYSDNEESLCVQSSATLEPLRDNFAMRVISHNNITVDNTLLPKHPRIS